MMSMRVLLILSLLNLLREASAWVGITQPLQQPAARQAGAPTTALFMCICVDCARVTNCAAYHFVETKHEQPHMTEDPTFTPRNGSPTIHVNVRTHRNNPDEIARLRREHASETLRAQQKLSDSGKSGAAAAAAAAAEGTLHGEKVYDLSPVTTIEYDVVACQDFILDKGCWVRNMPEEIRKANPDFVPT